MRQQVNLYQPRQRERGLLTLPGMAAVAGGVLSLLLVGSLFGAWSLHVQQGQLAALEAERSARAAELAQLERRHPVPREDAELAAQLARLERELAAKRVFLSDFQPEALGQREGFAGTLRGLARRPVQGLWLRELHLWGDGRLAITGSATEPRLVPLFVEGLGAEPVFRGRDFRRLQLHREQGQERIDFTLQTLGAGS